MRKSALFKCLFILFVAMVMVSWAAAVLDDDDSMGAPSCQAPVFWADQPNFVLPELVGQRPDVFFPLISGSSAGYLEMHEKSPPPARPVF